MEEDPTITFCHSWEQHVGSVWFLTRPATDKEKGRMRPGWFTGDPYGYGGVFEQALEDAGLERYPGALRSRHIYEGARLAEAIDILEVPEKFFIPVKDYDPDRIVFEIIADATTFPEAGFDPAPFGLAGLTSIVKTSDVWRSEPPLNLIVDDERWIASVKRKLADGVVTEEEIEADRALKAFAEQYLEGGVAALPRYNQFRISQLKA